MTDILISESVWFGPRAFTVGPRHDQTTTIGREVDTLDPVPAEWLRPVQIGRMLRQPAPAPATARQPLPVTQHQPQRVAVRQARKAPARKRPKCRGTCKLGVCTCGRR
ncbi:MAG: hypothetical protein ACYCQK_01750 [Acidiferrobacteraceae bacterium]